MKEVSILKKEKLLHSLTLRLSPRGCGGIGIRAGLRSLWAQALGGSSPLIRTSLRFSSISVDEVKDTLRSLGEEELKPIPELKLRMASHKSCNVPFA